MSVAEQRPEELARPHIIEALRAMLTHAESMPLRPAQVIGSGLTLTFQHGPVRCVLVTDLPGAPAVLSPREFEVARLVAHGATNRAIAARLEISTWTVSTHLRRIFAKLRVGTRAEMVSALFALPAAGVDAEWGQPPAFPGADADPFRARMDEPMAITVRSAEVVSASRWSCRAETSHRPVGISFGGPRSSEPVRAGSADTTGRPAAHRGAEAGGEAAEGIPRPHPLMPVPGAGASAAVRRDGAGTSGRS